ncbi:hypothetical protein NESM_000186600 [Novymonas esmeraldas]|uniref:Uncharacterized protein n=1 Tax=Novymonas esmeraldas TaxID=1808958 RepID=A0AAW0F3X5_9TRYP
MSHFLEARRDDELFAARLRVVNEETDALLLRTSRTRRELDRTSAEARMGVPLHFFPHDVAGRVEAATSVAGPREPQQLRDDLARSVVSAELAQWVRGHLPGLVAPLVEAQVQQQLQKLRDAVEEVRCRQAEVEKASRDAAEQVRAHRRDMNAAFAAAQGEAQRDMQEHQRSVERQLATWGEELRRVREDVHALKRHSGSTSEQQEQRITDALQRQHIHVQETLENLGYELQRWRQTTAREARRETQELQAQFGTLEDQLAQALGTLTSTAEMASDCAVDIRRLMEDAVGRSSETRLCRRDVNRLEMLVQCAALQTVSFAGAAGAGAGAGGGSSAAALVLNGVSQEMARLSDALHSVVGRVDGIDRHLRQLEATVARGMVLSGGGGGQSSHHGSARCMDEDSSYGRSLPSTRRPSQSHLSHSTALRSQRVSTGVFNSRSPSAQGEGDVDVDDGAIPLHSSGAAAAAAISSGTAPIFLRSAAQAGGADGAHEGSRVALLAADANADDDPRTTPVEMTSDWRIAAGRGGAAGATTARPRQRRSPPRVIPVRLGGAAIAGDSVATVPSAAAAPLWGSRIDNAASAVPPVAAASSSSSSTSAASALSPAQGVRVASEPADAANGVSATTNTSTASAAARRRSAEEAAATAESSHLRLEASATLPAVATRVSPVDSYVSDSPPDSYVSDTPAANIRGSLSASASASGGRLGEAARYTPAQGSDSESERDNLVIARSALD